MGRERDKTQFVLAARRRIAEEFQRLPILRRSRGTALYHYCTVLEVEAFKAGGDQIAVFAAHRRAIESAMHAIPVIIDHCVQNAEVDLDLNQAIFWEATDLLSFAYAFEQVSYSFELADKGQFEIHVASREPRITFAYASEEADAADTLLRSSEVSQRQVPIVRIRTNDLFRYLPPNALTEKGLVKFASELTRRQTQGA